MKPLLRFVFAFTVAIAFVVAFVLVVDGPVSADSITVTTLEDVLDAGGGNCAAVVIGSWGPDGEVSLREAVCAAENNAGDDYITFSEGGVITITEGRLRLEDDDGTTIDGDLNDDGSPDVEVRYESGTVTADAGLIVIRSSRNRIEGLAVTNSPEAGVYVLGYAGSVADENQIVNNWLGVDLTGAARGNDTYGLRIVFVEGGGSSARDNLIEGNVVSGNGSVGVRVLDAQNTRIISNTAGLNPAGTAALPNALDGIMISGAVSATIRGNVLSGNTRHGILLVDTDGVVIAGNKIGVDPTGLVGFGNGRFENKDGIQVFGAYSTTIGGETLADRNIIAHNGRAGVFISGETADYNVVWNNFIGTDVNGLADLGNGDSGYSFDTGDGGIYIEDGADHNLVQDNVIRYNYVGVRMTGGDSASPLPPQHNQVLSNTVVLNDKYGFLNQTTHGNITATSPSSGDNLIQYNVITGTATACSPSQTWCTGIGIFNYGASPYILDNLIAENAAFGIVNRVYFAADGAENSADDLLSMPYIVGNTVSANGDDGIQSRDTTPLNKDTLFEDNTFENNSGEPHISQRWFVAVEVVSGTETIASGVAVTITPQMGGSACPGGPCIGETFAAAGGGFGIWGATGIDYDNVETESTGQSTWFEVIEREIAWDDTPVTYTSHLVQVGGAYEGVKYYDFDGISTTEETTDDVNLPFCRETGILSDPDYSLCRYQIGQISVLGSFGDGDSDDDGIPDIDEGNDDTDGDGTPDYADDDSDGDGVPDSVEGDGDTDGDGTPDFQDDDDDGDGIPTEDEDLNDDGDPTNDDTDGDGTPDYRDYDDDGDGIPTEDEDLNDDGDPTNDDTDGDGTPDYRDDDDDGDGILTEDEDIDDDGDPTNDDTDGDGTPDYRDDDDDGDGILTEDEDVDDDGDPTNDDTDGDGTPDYRDNDDDGDGILTEDEDVDDDGDPTNDDTDGDGTPDYRDNDDDGDGIPTEDEDVDDDGDPTNDDTDGDGIPNYRDDDDDGDGVLTEDEDVDGDSDPTNDDTDGDTTPDYLDTDDDGDGVLTEDEDTDGDGDPTNDDDDGDGIPNYLDAFDYAIYLPIAMRSFGGLR